MDAVDLDLDLDVDAVLNDDDDADGGGIGWNAWLVDVDADDERSKIEESDRVALAVNFIVD